jgi:enoyl-CoA hydratase/carnithine racemase
MALIETRINDRVMEITLNRPDKRNALTHEMYRMLCDALTEAQQNADVHVVLMTGQDDCFTAGNDLHDFLAAPAISEETPVIRFLNVAAQFNKPLILAINGSAVGIGTTLCLHADMVIAGLSARFQLPFVRLGLVPEFASSLLLPQLVGHSQAFELLMLGEPFDAETAYLHRLVNAVGDDAHTLSEARAKAKALAELPIQAVIASKQLMKSHQQVQTLKAIEQEARLFAQRLNSDEAKQTMQQFFNR